MSEDSIEAKFTKLQNIKMTYADSIIENLVNTLKAAGYTVSELEQKRTILLGLSSSFVITGGDRWRWF